MATYLTLHVNITFKENTPSFVQAFFIKGVQHQALPNFLFEMGLNFSNKINLTTSDMLLTEYGAKTYVDGKSNTKLRLQLTQEFDVDAYAISIYPFITFVAAYAEDDCMAGYIKDEMQQYDAFAIKEGFVHWQKNQQIETVPKKKLDYFELVALGTKIKYQHGSDDDIKKYKEIFDANVPYPNGSKLLINEQFNDETVENTVEECLNFNPAK